MQALPPSTLVTGRVLSVDKLTQRIEMSLKASVVDPTKYTAPLKLAGLQPGTKLSAQVKRVESFGIFVVLTNSQLTALCHISEVSDEFVADTKASFTEGDTVKVVVLKVDTEKKRISVGMKRSYFDGDVVSDDEEEGGEQEGSAAAGADETPSATAEVVSRKRKTRLARAGVADSDADDSEEEEKEESAAVEATGGLRGDRSTATLAEALEVRCEADENEEVMKKEGEGAEEGRRRIF